MPSEKLQLFVQGLRKVFSSDSLFCMCLFFFFYVKLSEGKEESSAFLYFSNAKLP